MKIKIIAFCILYLFISKTIGQDLYSAKYMVVLDKKNYEDSFKDKSKSNINERIKNTLIKNQEEYLRISKKIIFTLNLDIESSVFSINRPLNSNNENKYYNGFLIELGYKGKYYTNMSKIIHQKNSFGEEFQINIKKPDWKILNITKKIGNYLCYKAVTKKTVENSRGIHKFNIIAWFSKEIPFSYGPKEFSGLPGLIVELQEGRKTYKLISFLKVKNKKLEKPTKGKKITLKEFNALSKKMFENRGN